MKKHKVKFILGLLLLFICCLVYSNNSDKIKDFYLKSIGERYSYQIVFNKGLTENDVIKLENYIIKENGKIKEVNDRFINFNTNHDYQLVSKKYERYGEINYRNVFSVDID